MFFRITVSTLLLVLAGCASLLHPVAEPSQPAAPGSRYEAESGRDAATIAQMRAAPPPATAEVGTGRNRTGDRRRLAASGFVHIGTGYFPGTAIAAREDAIRQGQRVGADKILLYAPASDAVAGDNAEWLATYYVRFQLPFGATFRDLHAQERAALGGSSGVEIGAVIGGTPASRANLIGGDFVIKFNGKPFANRGEFQALLKQHAGRPVTLTIVRNNETLERVVRLGAMANGTDR